MHKGLDSRFRGNDVRGGGHDGVFGGRGVMGNCFLVEGGVCWAAAALIGCDSGWSRSFPDPDKSGQVTRDSG